MFEFNTWIVNNLISGVKNGRFSKEWAAVQLANYYIKDKITAADIERFVRYFGISANDINKPKQVCDNPL